MKPKLTLALTLLASTVGLLSSVRLAHADTITLTLANPSLSNAYGNTLSYFATVSAPVTNTGIEYLNGDQFTVSAPTTLDDSGYVNNFPLDLTPGQSYYGLLFTIFIPPSAHDGNYLGSFSITGGPNAFSSTVLATVTFDAAAVPEPSTFLLLATGLAGGLAAAFYARRHERRNFALAPTI